MNNDKYTVIITYTNLKTDNVTKSTHHFESFEAMNVVMNGALQRMVVKTAWSVGFNVHIDVAYYKNDVLIGASEFEINNGIMREVIQRRPNFVIKAIEKLIRLWFERLNR